MVAPFEIDALGMWCPMARVTYWPDDEAKEKVSYNRIVDDNLHDRYVYHRHKGGASCHGNTCVLWRWIEAPAKSTDDDRERRGYCGLGGKPHVLEVGPYENGSQGWLEELERKAQRKRREIAAGVEGDL